MNKKKHRILMVCDYFHPNTGGVESHIYQLSQCLIQRGHKVIIMTVAYGPRYGIRYLTSGLKVYYVARQRAFLGSTLPTLFGGFCLLRNILIKEQIQIIHGHQTSSTLAEQAVIHARAMGYKTVFTDHSLYGFADAGGIFINKVLKYVFADIHQVICVSHTSKENTVLRACVPPSIVSVIPNAVDTNEFVPDINSREKDVITIVALTRLVYRKGIDLLAVIIPDVCHRYPHVKFLICGNGPKKSLIEKMIYQKKLGDRVKLLPAVPHSKARQILIKGDIFINASLTEAFCIAIVEAASAGLLVISTKVGGVPEVLPEDMVILSEPDPFSLSDAIDKAIIKVKDIDPLSQHERIKDMYNWHRVAERTEIVYDKTMSMTRDDSLFASFLRYYKCGLWAGKLYCFLASLLFMMAKILDWYQPPENVTKLPDILLDENGKIIVKMYK